MELESRMLDEPGFYVGVLVSPVVFELDMQFQIRGGLAINLLERFQEFLAPMPGFAIPDESPDRIILHRSGPPKDGLLLRGRQTFSESSSDIEQNFAEGS
jgi:hypothetical protein